MIITITNNTRQHTNTNNTKKTIHNCNNTHMNNTNNNYVSKTKNSNKILRAHEHERDDTRKTTTIDTKSTTTQVTLQSALTNKTRRCLGFPAAATDNDARPHSPPPHTTSFYPSRLPRPKSQPPPPMPPIIHLPIQKTKFEMAGPS